MVVEDSQSQAAGLTLILGGSRSGKSLWAERLAAAQDAPVLYMATGPARPEDEAWQERIRLHRQRRPPSWGCLETGAALSDCLIELQRPDHPDGGCLLLIDSLGTWLAQHLDAAPSDWNRVERRLLESLERHPTPVILVCEEVGLGVVPSTTVGGLFRDRMGALQQHLMSRARASWLIVAGRALDLHALGLPVQGS